MKFAKIKGQLTLEALLAFFFLLTLLAILLSATSPLYSSSSSAFVQSQEHHISAYQSFLIRMRSGAYRFVILPQSWDYPAPSQSPDICEDQTSSECPPTIKMNKKIFMVPT